jgi:hypothetical protein
MTTSESKKYPRTPHLPFSPGKGADDKVLDSVDHLLNVPLVLTEKMDGSNLCMTKEALFARSHSGPPTHPSFDLAKQLHAQVRGAIPNGLSIFGEYLYALHSIPYTDLPGYFLVFGVREDTTGKWWSWEMTKEMAKELNLPTIPYCATKIFRSDRDLQEVLEKLMLLPSNGGGKAREGHVVRISDEFTDFSKSVAKWVRKGHVQTDTHWAHQEITKNTLKNNT